LGHGGPDADTGGSSALSLLVPGVLANDANDAAALDHTTAVTHSLDRGSDLHDINRFLVSNGEDGTPTPVGTKSSRNTSQFTAKRPIL